MAIVAPSVTTHIDFCTTDSQEAREFFTQSYGTRVRLRGLDDGMPVRHSRVHAGLFTTDTAVLPGEMSISCDPLRCLVVVELDEGTLESCCEGGTQRIMPGQPLISAQPDLPYCIRFLDTTIRLITLDPDVVREVAGTPSKQPLRFTAFQPCTQAAAATWRQMTRFADNLIANEDAAANPMIMDNAARLLAATALAVFPNDLIPEPSPHDRNGATPETLSRAIAFIEANPDRDITVADIAAAACVTTRAIQLAFRRHLATTPMAYLRRVRLDQAHRDLLAGDPTRGATVTAIATRWGFAHPGRFSAYYRAVYKQSPRTTLHA